MPTHYQGPHAQVRALDLYIKLMRCSASLSQRLARHLEAEGVTVSQFAVLEALLHLGPMCPTEIARKLLVSGGNLTMVANNLRKAGLIERRQQSGDRRFVTLDLTADGKRLIKRVFAKHAAALTREVGVLSPAEQLKLASLCKKLGTGGGAGRKT